LKGNPLLTKSYEFALEVIELYKDIIKNEKEFILSKQLLKCITSIGPNISEANGTISKSDFSAKISIVYKESLEAKYWLMLLRDSIYISKRRANTLVDDADELSRIMFTILKTTRITKK
jgi:four helix bundle protein